MGFTRFDGVERIQGSSMPFESYLRQINMLYPNLPDLYFKYLTMIHDFYYQQYDKLKPYNMHIPYRDFLIDKALSEIDELKHTDKELYAAFVMLFKQFVFSEINHTSLKYDDYKSLHDSTVIDTLDSVSRLFDTDATNFLIYFTLMHQWYFDEYLNLREYNTHGEYRDAIIDTALFEILDFKNTDKDIYAEHLNDFVSYVVAELSDTDDPLPYEQKMTLFYHAVRDVLSATDVLYNTNDHKNMFYNIASFVGGMTEYYTDDVDTLFNMCTMLYFDVYQRNASTTELHAHPVTTQTISRKLFDQQMTQVWYALMTDISSYNGHQQNYFDTTCQTVLRMRYDSTPWYMTLGDSPHTAAAKMATVVNAIFSDLSMSTYTTMVMPIIDKIATWMPWLYYEHPGAFQVLETAMQNAKPKEEDV